MGQKVHPSCFRLGHKLINKWDLFAYTGKSSAKIILQTGLKVRKYIMQEYEHAQIAKVSINISNARFNLDIFCKKPGLIIGSSGAGIEKIKQSVQNMIKDASLQVIINVKEIKEHNVNARLIANSIAEQIRKRASFRKVMKKALQAAMKSGAKGIKIACSGRIAGADIARTEKYMEGTVPLHTLRANIDYALAESKTLYGIIGIKVWVHLEKKFYAKSKTSIPKLAEKDMKN